MGTEEGKNREFLVFTRLSCDSSNGKGVILGFYRILQLVGSVGFFCPEIKRIIMKEIYLISEFLFTMSFILHTRAKGH